MSRFIPDKPGQKFVLQMKSGLFYKGMKESRILTTAKDDDAFHFRSRLAACQVAATTAEFAGAYILAYNSPESQPEAQ